LLVGIMKVVSIAGIFSKIHYLRIQDGNVLEYVLRVDYGQRAEKGINRKRARG
jgi:hypothetical protein